MKTVLIWCLLSAVGLSQGPIGTLETDQGNGMASVIEVEQAETNGGHLAVAVSAAHVVENATVIKLKLDDGRVIKNCSVLVVDRENDVCLVRVWVPRGFKPLALAKDAVTHGHKLRMVGLKLRTMAGLASTPTTENRIYADIELQPGDSGGPVLNESGELVGVISGGWFWYSEKTWPARTSNLKPIRSMLQR